MINLACETLTDKEISDNLRLNGFSWCYFTTAKGKKGLYLVPSPSRAADHPVEIMVYENEEEDGMPSQRVAFEQSFYVPRNQHVDFFNNLIGQLNNI